MADPESLARRIALRTAAAWVCGVLAFASLALWQAAEGAQAELDSQLRIHALAAYGLGWWDDAGHFHGEYIDREAELLDAAVQISVAKPGALVYGAELDGREALVAEVMATGEEVWVDGPERRSLGIVSYDEADAIVGAVIASTSTRSARGATRRFAAIIGLAALALIGLGLIMSRVLAARLLTALEASLRERERILAGAAHELRTPMATLLAQIDSTPAGEEAATLVALRETTARSARMVESLLTWSRLAHAELEREPVRLDLLAELLVDEDAGESFEASEPVVVEGDPRLLEVALSNLVLNARVHGGGLERVRVLQADGRARVEIHDRGPGIAGEHLLDPFCKGEASRGSGLGLALVRRIADRHSGSFEITPLVTLELPLAAD